MNSRDINRLCIDLGRSQAPPSMWLADWDDAQALQSIDIKNAINAFSFTMYPKKNTIIPKTLAPTIRALLLTI